MDDMSKCLVKIRNSGKGLFLSMNKEQLTCIHDNHAQSFSGKSSGPLSASPPFRPPNRHAHHNYPSASSLSDDDDPPTTMQSSSSMVFSDPSLSTNSALITPALIYTLQITRIVTNLELGLVLTFLLFVSLVASN
jgi:hypothetical protein